VLDRFRVYLAGEGFQAEQGRIGEAFFLLTRNDEEE